VPVRGVTAECRTRRVNCPARLRSAGFFNEDFNILSTRIPGPRQSGLSSIIGLVGARLQCI